jgi:hypothetical protein
MVQGIGVAAMNAAVDELRPDPDAAIDFLRHLRPGGPWQLSAIAQEGQQSVGLEHFIDPAPVRIWIEARQAERCNVYFLFNQARSGVTRMARKSDIAAAWGLFADKDLAAGTPNTPENLDKLVALARAIVPRFTYLVVSGGGVQMAWLTAAPVTAKDGKYPPEFDELERACAAIGNSIQADAVQNINRLLRLPGTVNFPSERKRNKGRVTAMAYVVEADWSRRWRPGDAVPTLLQLVRAANAAAAGGARHNIADLPAKLQKLILKPDYAKYGGNRSDAVFSVCCQLIRRGWTDDEITALLLDRGNDISEHIYAQEGRKPDDCALRQALRAREAVAKDENAAKTALGELVTTFNRRYAVANEAGRAVIFEQVTDPLRNRLVLTRFQFEDFRKLFMNRNLTLTAGEKQVTRSVADWWLTSPARRQYIGGVVFDPTGKVAADFWNLWTGFAVPPSPGDWSLMQKHISAVICGGSNELSTYLLNFVASMFQKPNVPGEVAIVLRGSRGAGKGIFLNWLLRAWGQHGLYISNPKHLVGNFNAHLRDCVMLFADEAFFAGDRAHEGILKALITEPLLAVESKYQNLVEVANMLHVFMSSNSDWVVPAALDERRFCVADVVNSRVGERKYFKDIAEQMAGGGLAAMIHEMLGRDISKFEVRDIPKTAALRTQKTLSLGSLERWWLAVLSREFLWKSRHGTPWFRDWHEFYTTELLERSYLQWCDQARPYDRKNRVQLGAFFTKVYQSKRPREAHPVYEIESVRLKPDDELRDYDAIFSQDHPHGYQVGDIAAARARFRELHVSTSISGFAKSSPRQWAASS